VNAIKKRDSSESLTARHIKNDGEIYGIENVEYGS